MGGFSLIKGNIGGGVCRIFNLGFPKIRGAWCRLEIRKLPHVTATTPQAQGV